MEHEWNMNGILMEYELNMDGILMDYEWNIYGILMEIINQLYLQWNNNGTIMGY